MSLFLCLHTKILHVHIMFPPPPRGWVGGVLPSAAMYRYNYMFVLIYGLFVCMYVCTSVCWYVSMCVPQQGRHVIVFVSAHKDTTCTHNVPAPPPVGGLGGSYHLQPCIGITICLYVCTCPSNVGVSFLLCMQTKILCLSYVCMCIRLCEDPHMRIHKHNP